ncbi:MAG TPA: MaoC family dehydratase N-terminal domain-containing protein [Alphaproteobacteria bacterium]
MDTAMRDWVGREETVEDVVTASALAKMSATLGRDDPPPAPGDPVPPGWHWMFAHAPAPAAQLGPDGHTRRGGFLPPVAQPRRMWAGGRLTFGPPLRVGQTVTRRSTVLDIAEKTGRSGPLVFVTVRHDYAGPDGSAVVEEQDLVFRAAPRPGEQAPAPETPLAATWRRTVSADSTMLFRYSALTFNGHRIHYDHPYATREEGYPGLVVHGPLLATLMLDLVRREAPGRTIERFSFRGMRPVFDTAPFEVAGAPATDGTEVALWITESSGAVAMRASARFAE